MQAPYCRQQGRSGVLKVQDNFLLLLLLLFGPCCCEGLIVTSSQQQQRRHIVRRCATQSGSQSPHKDGSSSSSSSRSILEQIRKQATVWADTADVDTVERLKQSLGLEDVTTNPSIVSATARLGAGAAGVDLRLQTQTNPGTASALEGHERIAVDLGRRLLDIVPGRVCTQLDIRCTDAGEMVAKARDLVAAYTEVGVPQDRVLIKTPATWQGIRATERLEQEGIKCLVTLVCSQVQGRAAAEAGASLIATYVGRVSDWHKAATTNEGPAATESAAAAPAPCASGDPGVVLTVDLKEYFVAHGFSTQVMAASFRNADQVAALAACDHLTIAPGLLEDLAKLPPRDSLPGMLSLEDSEVQGTQSARSTKEAAVVVTPARLDAKAFIAALRRDVCGTDVLRSSIEGFTRDTLALEDAIAKAKQ